MSGSTLLSGTKVPARSIVSAGSVVNTPLTEELTFYSGNPAEAVRTLPETLGSSTGGRTLRPTAVFWGSRRRTPGPPVVPFP